MLINNFLLIIKILLLFSVIHCARHKDKADEKLNEAVQNNKITTLAEEAKLYFDIIINENFLNDKSTVNEIYALIRAVNELNIEIIKLSQLLMDDTSNCGEEYHRVKVELESKQVIEKPVRLDEDVKKIAPNVKFNGDPEDIETLKEALHSTSETSSTAQNVMITLLDAQKQNILSTVDNAFKARSLQYALKHDQESLMTEQLFVEACDQKKEKLKLMRNEMNDKLSRIEDFKRETGQHTRVITASTINLKIDFVEQGAGKFTCQIDISQQDTKLQKSLNLDEIDNQIKIIGLMQTELLLNVPLHLQDVENVRQKIENVSTALQEHITFLQKVSETLQKQEDEFLKLLIKALEENDKGAAHKYYSYLQDIQSARRAVQIEYERTNKNFEETLKSCNTIIDFGAKIGAVVWLHKTSGSRGINKYLFDLYAREINLYYDANTNYFSAEIPFLISKMYYSTKSGTLATLLTFQRQIESQKFLLHTKETWKSEVILFLDSNLILITKSQCHPELFAPLKKRKEEYMIFTVVSLEIFLQMMKHNEEVRSKLTDLKIIMLAYWRNLEYLNEIEFCKKVRSE